MKLEDAMRIRWNFLSTAVLVGLCVALLDVAHAKHPSDIEHPRLIGQEDSLFAGLEPSAGGLMIVERAALEPEGGPPRTSCGPSSAVVDVQLTDQQQSDLTPAFLLGAKGPSRKLAENCSGCAGHMYAARGTTCGPGCIRIFCTNGYGNWEDGCDFCWGESPCSGCNEDDICWNP